METVTGCPDIQKGSKTEPTNYRPISLTSIFSKIYEKSVLKYILDYLLTNNLIYPFQAGFLPNHSTVYQLIEIYHRIAQNIDDQLATSLIFCDISRAFDRLSHRGLYIKLEQFGFSTEMRNWIHSFLSDRKQRTIINGYFSEWGDLKGGVPQGSVLGPVAWLLMINDLPKFIKNDTRLFADDTSIIFSHKPDHDISDVMTEDLIRLQTWADAWMITLNPSKTVCMNITMVRNKVIPEPKSQGQPIQIVKSHKHLGLYLNDTANWSDHIEYLVSKVSRRIGVLRSLKYKLNRSSLKTIYMSHIRSLMEYCHIAWDNCTHEETTTIERLPRFCSKEILDLESGLETLWSDVDSNVC